MPVINLLNYITNQQPGGTWGAGFCDGTNLNPAVVDLSDPTSVNITVSGVYTFSYTTTTNGCVDCSDVSLGIETTFDECFLIVPEDLRICTINDSGNVADLTANAFFFDGVTPFPGDLAWSWTDSMGNPLGNTQTIPNRVFVAGAGETVQTFNVAAVSVDDPSCSASAVLTAILSPSINTGNVDDYEVCTAEDCFNLIEKFTGYYEDAYTIVEFIDLDGLTGPPGTIIPEPEADCVSFTGTTEGETYRFQIRLTYVWTDSFPDFCVGFGPILTATMVLSLDAGGDGGVTACD